MRLLVFYIIVIVCVSGCKPDEASSGYHQPDWSIRKIKPDKSDSLKKGRTYLPVYAQIYEMSEERRLSLAVTVSIRNTDVNDSIYLEKIDYYDTNGQLLRQYLTTPVFLKPAETIEIVIKSSDNDGGTGANFIFEWYTPARATKPLFESVMISTSGQQGISFTSRGVEL